MEMVANPFKAPIGKPARKFGPHAIQRRNGLFDPRPQILCSQGRRWRLVRGQRCPWVASEADDIFLSRRGLSRDGSGWLCALWSVFEGVPAVDVANVPALHLGLNEIVRDGELEFRLVEPG